MSMIGASSKRLAFVVALAVMSVAPCPAQTITTSSDPTQPTVVTVQTTEASEPEKTDDGLPPLGPSVCEVTVSEYMTVDLLAQNVRMSTVLQHLGVKSRRNIILASGADRVVSATLYGVPYYEALEALLEANGLGYIERGEFIKVYAADDLEKRLLSEAGPQTKVIKLDYLRPDDAKEAVGALLSDIGKVSVTKDDEELDAGTTATSVAEQQEQEDKVYTPNKDEYPVFNSLVVFDYQPNIDRIEQLLAELDTRPDQVLLEATIIQATLNEQNAFGVDFALIGDVQFTEFFRFPETFDPLSRPDRGDPGTLAPDVDRNDGFIVSDPGNTGQGDATIRGGITFGDAGIFIRALDKVTDVTLLSNPKVLALNRQRAKVLVGTRVGYFETTTVENQVLQSLKFIDTGISLDVRPFIMKDGRIRLELSPKVSAVKFREVQDAQGVTSDIPDEDVQTVSTDIMVPPGHTAVLGGLFREDVRRERSQVPILGDIPLAGAAFKGHDDAIDRVEIIFMIKPTILREGELIEQGKEGMRYWDRVRTGTRLGLLPWSRELQSAKHNLEAERLAAAGDMDKALWHLRRSLELNPQQPETIRIRERLVAHADDWTHDSFLRRTIEAQSRAAEEAHAAATATTEVTP